MRVNRYMKMLSLQLEDILDDNMDKADKANVSTIVGDFKIMDKADVADVSAIVGVKATCMVGLSSIFHLFN
jgi:hypothetical protein